MASEMSQKKRASRECQRSEASPRSLTLPAGANADLRSTPSALRRAHGEGDHVRPCLARSVLHRVLARRGDPVRHVAGNGVDLAGVELALNPAEAIFQ